MSSALRAEAAHATQIRSPLGPVLLALANLEDKLDSQEIRIGEAVGVQLAQHASAELPHALHRFVARQMAHMVWTVALVIALAFGGGMAVGWYLWAGQAPSMECSPVLPNGSMICRLRVTL